MYTPRTKIQHHTRLSLDMPRIGFMRRPCSHIVYPVRLIFTGGDTEEETVVDIVEIGCVVLT